MSEQNPSSSYVTKFIMGAISTVLTTTMNAPIDRVKLLIQNQDELIKQGRLTKNYAGIIDCFVRIANEEGIISFWRGNTASIIKYFPKEALNFAFHDKIRNTFENSQGYWTWFAGNLLSGGLSGVISMIFVYSLEFTRIRMATDIISPYKENNVRQFNSLFDVYWKILTTDGVTGLYRGFIPSVMGVFVFRAMYFGLFDSLKPMVLVGPLKQSFIASFLLGWFVTLSSSVATYPLDTIRTRMMMTSGEAIKYRGAFDAFTQIVATEGFKSLFKGCSVNILKSIPGAIFITIYSLFSGN